MPNILHNGRMDTFNHLYDAEAAPPDRFQWQQHQVMHLFNIVG